MNFQDALNVKGDAIERPKLPPQGTYIASVSKAPVFGTVGKDKNWETCDFPMRLVQPMEDVDPEELAAFGDISSQVIRHRFMFSKDDQQNFDRSMFNMRNFLEKHLQIDGYAKMTVKKALADSVNHQCLVTVNWRPDPSDPEVQYLEIGRTAPAE